MGSLEAKLAWAGASGAAAAFTWIAPSRNHDFTRRSGVPHHWLPFAVDPRKYARHAGRSTPQPIDVGFTGASGLDKYPDRAAVLETIRAMNTTNYLGTWLQTKLNRADNRSWKAMSHAGYARTLASAKLWVSTTGPSELVGTRFFEVLASGTTMLLCNAPRSPSTYDGLFVDGVHAVTFNGMPDLQAKIVYYLRNEGARRRIVDAAHQLALQLHTWDARARFISLVAEKALSRQAGLSSYTQPAEAAALEAASRYLGCYEAPSANQLRTFGFREPAHSRNRRRLWRYTVQLCQEACRGATFGLMDGGFSSGNAHAQGRCICSANRGRSNNSPSKSVRRRRDRECATACSLHDARPCGGPGALALFQPVRKQSG